MQVRVSTTAVEAAQFGRRRPPDGAADVSDIFDEASDFVEVMRRLWDSWEDDAEIRDVTTGRFVDRERLHYIDFEGKWFSVKGPGITPRPPQGQPVVAALAHSTVPYRLAARQADMVFITPFDPAGIRAIEGELRREEADAARTGDALRVIADLVVFLDAEPGVAAARLAALDDLIGKAYRSDALVFAGTPAELADLLQAWQAAPTDGPGLAGFRLRPGTLPYDLEMIGRSLVPELTRRGVFPSESGRRPSAAASASPAPPTATPARSDDRGADPPRGPFRQSRTGQSPPGPRRPSTGVDRAHATGFKTSGSVLSTTWPPPRR